MAWCLEVVRGMKCDFCEPLRRRPIKMIRMAHDLTVCRPCLMRMLSMLKRSTKK
jgi:hypothetical protein